MPVDVIIKPGRQIIPLGFAMEMEEGCEALVDPRSGFSSKGMEGYEVITSPACVFAGGRGYGRQVFSEWWSQECPNGQVRTYIAEEPDRFDCDVIEGKIDSDYRDGCGVIVHNRDSRTFLVKAGTRIAQMTFHKVESVDWDEVEELSESDRKGGFGHSGTK